MRCLCINLARAMPCCAQDHGQLYGGMLMLRLLTRKYEFKDEDEREPLAQIVSVAFPPLLAIFQVHAARTSEMLCKMPCTLLGASNAANCLVLHTAVSQCCRACWRGAAFLRRQHSS
jgi:hypothetical protein